MNMDKIEMSGLYIIKDQYFRDYPSEKYMDNKGGTRPHFYAVQDARGLYWMIPISSKVEKFRAKIKMIEEKSGEGSCFLYAITEIAGRERALVIAEMFPVTLAYIERAYTVKGIPYVVRNRETQKVISQKAFRFLSMLEHGRVKSPVNALLTREKLCRTP